MCSRCVTVRRVCFEKSSGPKVGGEKQSKENYLFSWRVVGIARARWITKRDGIIKFDTQ